MKVSMVKHVVSSLNCLRKHMFSSLVPAVMPISDMNETKDYTVIV